MRCGAMTSATTSGRGTRVTGQCWFCDRWHTYDEFPTVNGVHITYGYMGDGCRRLYNELPPDKQAILRAKGHARYERAEASRK
jgi:hypothetical protein